MLPLQSDSRIGQAPKRKHIAIAMLPIVAISIAVGILTFNAFFPWSCNDMSCFLFVALAFPAGIGGAVVSFMGLLIPYILLGGRAVTLRTISIAIAAEAALIFIAVPFAVYGLAYLFIDLLIPVISLLVALPVMTLFYCVYIVIAIAIAHWLHDRIATDRGYAIRTFLLLGVAMPLIIGISGYIATSLLRAST